MEYYAYEEYCANVLKYLRQVYCPTFSEEQCRAMIAQNQDTMKSGYVQKLPSYMADFMRRNLPQTTARVISML